MITKLEGHGTIVVVTEAGTLLTITKLEGHGTSSSH